MFEIRASKVRVLTPIHRFLLIVALALAVSSGARADGGITFTNIADDPGSGIDFQRTRSLTFAGIQALREQSLSQPLDPNAIPTFPTRTWGLPGVAVLDFDGDGDLDIYATNGPGTPNSLYSNQLTETGAVTFVDVAVAAGVAATDQDSTGLCFGDTDNDGDHDLMVLGRSEPNRFFENQGDGTFTEILSNGLDGGNRSSVSCAMGDLNGDGLLEVVVSNTFEYTSMMAIFVEPVALNQHNQIYLNRGGNLFFDISESSGVEQLNVVSLIASGAASISWAVAVADIDEDGDSDIIFADDQGGIPVAAYGGVDRGLVHLMLNDGTAHFIDQPIYHNSFSAGSWMGLSIGDLNCDGNLDIFGSNFGDYGLPIMGMPYQLGEQTSRWFLGNGDGTFTDPGVGALGATPFGWGSAIFDYDNDGDSDILYHGSLDMAFLAISDNPGTILQNQGCSANFTVDSTAITTNHLRRNVQGVAVGDLDRNGFVDVVTSSNGDFPEPMPLVPAPVAYGSPFDATAFFVPFFAPTPDGMVWTGLDAAPGGLAVELNSGGNGNGSVTVVAKGSIGLIPDGAVNRDGIGAVVSFTPMGGQTVIKPVSSGSTYLSQHSLEQTFGLGSELLGTVEVLWPGGVRNRVYGAVAGERLVVQEIPCSFDNTWTSSSAYMACVTSAVDGLISSAAVTPTQGARLWASAILAFFDK